MENSKNNTPIKKLSFEDEVKQVEIKNREKFYFESVFKELCALEKEPSSDENSKEKRYLREIEEKVKLKQMKIPINNFKSKTMSKKSGKKRKLKDSQNESKISLPDKKEYAEDSNTGKIDLYKDPEKEEEKLRHDRFGKKALRKIFSLLENYYF